LLDPEYQSYQSFKSWIGDPDASHDAFFSMEISPLHLSKGARIVEVGFGEGRFLDYARRAGYAAIGIEIIPDLVERVRARGHTALVGKLSDLHDQAKMFDLVVALDLIEHLSVDEIKEFLRDAAHLLRDGGFIFLRFPNGGSPFSLPLYNGDVTHRSYLNVSSLMQLAGPLGFRVVRAGNASRDLPAEWLPRFHRRIAFAMRTLIETAFGIAYFGKRVPMDANLVVILTK
jgi:2-polyprenyl-3-methyl-5-hydroxy-6-metoxy-1,4-benzoquinol methylase